MTRGVLFSGELLFTVTLGRAKYLLIRIIPLYYGSYQGDWGTQPTIMVTPIHAMVKAFTPDVPGT